MSTLNFHFVKPRDLLNKLARDLLRLENAASSYDEQLIADCLFDFCGTGNAVRDWLKENCGSAFQPQQVDSFFRASQVLEACRDICNSYKHHTITKYFPSTQDVYASTSAVTTVAVTLPATGVALESDPKPRFRVKVLLNDGTKFEVVEFAKLVSGEWDKFFTSKGI